MIRKGLSGFKLLDSFEELFPIKPSLREKGEESDESLAKMVELPKEKPLAGVFSSNLVSTLVTYRNYPKNTLFYFFTLFLAYPKLFTKF